jgi:hypothetical protein
VFCPKGPFLQVYVAILQLHATILQVYATILQVHAAILRMYVAILQVHAAIWRVYAAILRVDVAILAGVRRDLAGVRGDLAGARGDLRGAREGFVRVLRLSGRGRFEKSSGNRYRSEVRIRGEIVLRNIEGKYRMKVEESGLGRISMDSPPQLCRPMCGKAPLSDRLILIIWATPL